MAKLRRRSCVGVRKYGVTLAAAVLSPRQWLTHLQEELLDAVNYLEAVLSVPPQSRAVSKRKEPRRG